MLIALAGCTNKPANCSDPSTLTLLKKNYVDFITQNNPDRLEDAKNRVGSAVIEQIKEVSYDEEMKRYKCEATLNVDISDALMFEGEIEYVSQLDGKNAQFVSMTTMLNLDLGKSAIASYVDSSRSQPTDVSKPNISVKTKEPTSEIKAAEEACLDGKISAFRKELGDEPLITHDMLEEWEEECRVKNKQGN